MNDPEISVGFDVPAVIRETATTGQHPNKTAILVLIGTIISSLVPLVWYLAKSGEPQAGFVIALWIVSSFLIVCGAIRLLPIQQKPPHLTMFVGVLEVLKNILPFIYYLCVSPKTSSQWLARSEILAWSSLVLAAAAVVLIFQLISLVMGRTTADGTIQAGSGDGVIHQLLQYRFLGVGALIVIFLQVSLFLSMAIAFHNLAMSRKALRRVIPKAVSDDRGVRESKALVSDSGASQSKKTTDDGEEVHLLAFRQGTASLQCSQNFDLDSLRDSDTTFFRSDTPHDWRVARLRELTGDAVSAGCAAELQQMAWNLTALNGIHEALVSRYEVTERERYRIVILAHANETPTSKSNRFASNYELSKARAEQVQDVLESMLLKLQRQAGTAKPPMNVEWLLQPVADEKASLLAERSPRLLPFLAAKPLNRELTAEIKIIPIPGHVTTLERAALELDPGEQGRKLDLLDYVYFIIGTAGYGDLLPASEFVQFVVCVARLFELFFLVVAFHVVLALRRAPIRQDRTRDRPSIDQPLAYSENP